MFSSGGGLQSEKGEPVRDDSCHRWQPVHGEWGAQVLPMYVYDRPSFLLSVSQLPNLCVTCNLKRKSARAMKLFMNTCHHVNLWISVFWCSLIQGQGNILGSDVNSVCSTDVWVHLCPMDTFIVTCWFRQSYMKGARAQTLGWKVLILKYYLGKGLSKEMWC